MKILILIPGFTDKDICYKILEKNIKLLRNSKHEIIVHLYDYRNINNEFLNVDKVIRGNLGLYNVFISYDEIVDLYDYIFVILDDVELINFDLDKFINYHEIFDLDISSPSVMKDSYTSHNNMFSNETNTIDILYSLELFCYLMTPIIFHKWKSIMTEGNGFGWSIDTSLHFLLQLKLGLYHFYTIFHHLRTTSIEGTPEHKISSKQRIEWMKEKNGLVKWNNDKSSTVEINNGNKTIVLGAGGFIGGHLVKRLKKEGYWVRGVDLKTNEWRDSFADEFIIGDLRDKSFVEKIIENNIDEIYQLAADMGGAGYLFTGDNDADIMYNSIQINLNVLQICVNKKVKKIFYSSSACIYPISNQLDPINPICSEDSVYPAQPDSEYGWEKLFSERLYQSFRRNYGLNIRIGRFHNIFGPFGEWKNGKEKAPAALARKVAFAEEGSSIEIWGDGNQTRSFLYIDECIEAIRRLMNSEINEPINIGSEEMITINKLAEIYVNITGKNIKINHIDGPIGVRGRNSDNKLIYEKLNWKPTMSLLEGLEITYDWIKKQVDKNYR